MRSWTLVLVVIIVSCVILSACGTTPAVNTPGQSLAPVPMRTPRTPVLERPTPNALATLEARVATIEAAQTALAEDVSACCRGPHDPGGHVFDSAPGGTPRANFESEVTLFVVEGARPDGPSGSPKGQCRRMSTRRNASGAPVNDWGYEPTVEPLPAPSGGTTIDIGTNSYNVTLASNLIPPSPVPPPGNPLTILAGGDGSYGWQAPLGACYYVQATRADGTHYSPLVGVVDGEPVNDLDHCWSKGNNPPPPPAPGAWGNLQRVGAGCG
jgi:hypothetical protein